MRFFFDNCMPYRLSLAMQIMVDRTHPVVLLREKFGRPDVKDPVWIPVLGQEGNWTIITADLRILQRPAERALWLKAGLPTFFMVDTYSSQKMWDQVRWLVDAWPAIQSESLAAIAGTTRAWRVTAKRKLEPLPI